MMRLNDLNRTFYQTTAQEFDQTRGRAWNGWKRLLPYLHAPLSVLDVGCGNGRFGAFVAEHAAGMVRYEGLDNSPELLAYAREALQNVSQLSATLRQFDLMLDALPDATYDLVVLFGVVHHIPGAQQRQDFLHGLAQRVNVGGYLCFATWRFYEDARLRERIVPWEAGWQVEQHDYLLDWRRGERALRYCHYVDDAEQQALISATGLAHVESYRADGADDRLNCYSILRRI